MKRIILILCLGIIAISSVFALNATPSSSIQLNFTAGLIANMGFSSRKVEGMVYPSANILNEARSFSFNEKTGKFETGDFYVFCQVFSADISEIKLSGEALTLSNNDTTNANVSSIGWVNTTADASFSSSKDGENKAIILYSSPPKSETFSPDYSCLMLNLRLEDIKENVAWDAEYSGSLTLTIVADKKGETT